MTEIPEFLNKLPKLKEMYVFDGCYYISIFYINNNIFKPFFYNFYFFLIKLHLYINIINIIYFKKFFFF